MAALSTSDKVPPSQLPPRVLCLAGRRTSSEVQHVAATFSFLSTTMVSNVASALVELENRYKFVVVALGFSPSTMIFDMGDRSRVLEKAHSQGATVIVYSHTAKQNPGTALLCYHAGAHYVVNVPRELQKVFSEHLVQAVSYAPLERFEESLATVAAKSDHCYVECKHICTKLRNQVAQLTWPLLNTSASPCVRVVAISDTHTKHGALELPPGDVLLHTGDVVGNYGGNFDLQAHFTDFVAFLQDQAALYKHVVWIAGNHDTFLDTDHYQKRWVAPLTQKLQDCGNVHYLENSGLTVLGLNIYGTPWLPCRRETLNKRYYSNAFERHSSVREPQFEHIPEGLDILMTHCPPKDVCGVCPSADPLLERRLNAMKRPPKVHCFGHAHNSFGLYEKTRNGATTLHVNAAQDKMLGNQQYLRTATTGIPLIFDICTG